MVFQNGFGVVIVSQNNFSARELNLDGYDYVSLENGTIYKIRLVNNRNTLCDVSVDVNGQFIGAWRINSNSSIEIERPANVNKKFTFFAENSRQALNAGTIQGSIDNGLIKATFKPKKEVVYQLITNTPQPYIGINPLSASQSRPASRITTMESAPRYQSGTTLLGETSYQQFSNTDPLRPEEIDKFNITTIIIRLIVDNQYLQIPPRIDQINDGIYHQPTRR